MTFYRSQLIPCDTRTMVYWYEDSEGECHDISDTNIPDGAVVTDITYQDMPKKVIKTDGLFRNYMQ